MILSGSSSLCGTLGKLHFISMLPYMPFISKLTVLVQNVRHSHFRLHWIQPSRQPVQRLRFERVLLYGFILPFSIGIEPKIKLPHALTLA